MSEDKKSGIKTQKINSEAIVKYTMQSNLLQNLILNLDEDLKNQKMDVLKDANIEKVPNLKYVKIKDICKHIGAKI